MIRTAVAILLLASASTCLGTALLDCGSGSNFTRAWIVPNRPGIDESSTIGFSDQLPFAVKTFGTPIVTSETPMPDGETVEIHQLIVGSKSDRTPTCHSEAVPFRPVTVRTLFDIRWFYDIAFDDGTVVTQEATSRDLLSGVDYYSVEVHVTPPSPTTTSSATLVATGYLPSLGNVFGRPRVAVNGNRIDVEVDVYEGFAEVPEPMLMNVDLGSLPAGNYDIGFSAILDPRPSGQRWVTNRAETQFTVVPAPKHRASHH